MLGGNDFKLEYTWYWEQPKKGIWRVLWYRSAENSDIVGQTCRPHLIHSMQQTADQLNVSWAIRPVAPLYSEEKSTAEHYILNGILWNTPESLASYNIPWRFQNKVTFWDIWED